MDINSLTIGQAKELATLFGGSPQASPGAVTGNGRAVIVRSRDAGVQFGYLEGYEGRTVRLKDAIQMWSWKAAKGGTLLDCATYGVDVKNSKFSSPNASVVVLDACAIIDVTAAAAETIKAVKWS